MSEPTTIKAQPGYDYRRVEEIVQRDPSLQRFLGPKTVTVERRSGNTSQHSSELIALMDAMSVAGIIMSSCPKPTTLHFAMKFFMASGTVSGVKPPLQPPPAPAVPTTPTLAPPVTLKAAPPKKEEPAKRVAKPEEKVTFCAAVALANMVMAMLQLAEQYDTSPGFEKRKEKLNSLATEYERLTKDYLDGQWETARKNAKA